MGKACRLGVTGIRFRRCQPSLEMLSHTGSLREGRGEHSSTLELGVLPQGALAPRRPVAPRAPRGLSGFRPSSHNALSLNRFQRGSPAALPSPLKRTWGADVILKQNMSVSMGREGRGIQTRGLSPLLVFIPGEPVRMRGMEGTCPGLNPGRSPGRLLCDIYSTAGIC